MLELESIVEIARDENDRVEREPDGQATESRPALLVHLARFGSGPDRPFSGIFRLLLSRARCFSASFSVLIASAAWNRYITAS
jgi:hypothetical protein